MQDPILLNGMKRCTLIQRFNYTFTVIGPGGTDRIDSLKSLSEVEAEVAKRGWVVGIVHPAQRKTEEVQR